MTPTLAVILNPSILAVGAIQGLVYGVLGVGLVLVYRSSKVINLAAGQIGAFCAAVLADLVINEHWPFVPALVLAVALGAVIGALSELLVIRRLFGSPRLIVLVATIGLSQVMLLLQFLLPGIHDSTAPYPSPLHVAIPFGSTVLVSSDVMVLIIVPAVVLCLGGFLAWTRLGLAVRASASNPDAARLARINIRRVSTVVWAVAGGLAAVSVVLLNPLRGVQPGVPQVTLGASMLLRALAAAAIGGMTSMPLTLLGGVLIGAVEAVLLANNSTNPGVADLMLFGVVLIVVLLRGSWVADGDYSLGLTPRFAVIERTGEAVRRRLRTGGIAIGLLVALLAPLVFSTPIQLFNLSQVPIFAIVAVSATVLIGWSGQLSLGQFAFVGVGAMTTAALTARGVPFAGALCFATIGGVVLALAIGYPALRIQGLFLAVTTLGFAVACTTWLLGRSVFVGSNASATATVNRPVFLGVNFAAERPYYYLCVAVLAVVALMVSHLRRTGIGRSIRAVRENPQAAAMFAISPATSKLASFAISGGIAALAGGLYGGLFGRITATDFTPDISLTIVAIAVIGGLGSVPGAVLGATFIVGVPQLLGNTPTAQAATGGIGLLVVILLLPDGLISVVHQIGERLTSLLTRRDLSLVLPPEADKPANLTPARAVQSDHLAAMAATVQPVEGDQPALEVCDLTVRFGGLVAVDSVSITVGPGEVVGLIGANGAGKSTLMAAISGFVPSRGGVSLFDADVSTLSPHKRARLGLGRIFQDARLFGDLTVDEVVRLALEDHDPSELVPSLLAFPTSTRSEAAKVRESREIIGSFGLKPWCDVYIADLSTGLRRIVELACLVAARPQLMLLDEPTAGVAQRESEQFGGLITQVRQAIGASILIVEHDMPMIMGLSDRIYCMSLGSVVAEGSPQEIRHNSVVVASYLGTDDRSILRSG